MKAPDVIYLAESDKVKSEVSSNFASENPFKTHTSIAYIRKEALLEWIEKEIQALSDGSLSGYYISLAYKDMIEHLNEM